MIRINLLSKEGVSEQFKKLVGMIAQFWNDYNVFSYISLILVFFSFFIIFIDEGPTYYLFFINFFSLNLSTSLIGILFILGFCFLLRHFFGGIYKIYGNAANSTKNPSNFYVYLSLFAFLSFDILTYIYFIILPFPFTPQIIFCGFVGGCVYFPRPYELAPGFSISLVLTCMILLSIIYNFIYDKIVLRQLYKTYLPMYAPNKHQNLDEFDEI